MKTKKIGNVYVTAGKSNIRETSGRVSNDEFVGIQGMLGKLFLLIARPKKTGQSGQKK